MREKNADLLIFEKIAKLKATEFFAPVNEIEILNLVISINESYDTSQSNLQHIKGTDTDAMIVRSEEGYILRIPNENIYEMMTGDPVMTARYLKLFFNNNNA